MLLTAGACLLPDVKLRRSRPRGWSITTDSKSKTAFVEAKNISLDAALGVAAPSMEDDVLDAIGAAYARGSDRTCSPPTKRPIWTLPTATWRRWRLNWPATRSMEEWYYTPRRVTNMPTGGAQPPASARLLRGSQPAPAHGHGGRGPAALVPGQQLDGVPGEQRCARFRGFDIYGRIAQREDTWGIAAGIMQQADAAIAAGGRAWCSFLPSCWRPASCGMWFQVQGWPRTASGLCAARRLIF